MISIQNISPKDLTPQNGIIAGLYLWEAKKRHAGSATWEMV